MNQRPPLTHVQQPRPSSLATFWSFGKNNRGTTAIEFGLLVVPFIAFVFGIFSFSLFFFTEATLTNALTDASRSLRTGQFQTSTGAYSGTSGIGSQVAVLQAAMCKELPAEIKCNQIVLMAQSTDSFSSITQPVCAINGNLISQSTANQTFNAGTASSVVLLTACYPWSLGPSLPFLPTANLKNGAFLIQTSVVLQVEPYN